MRSTHRTLLVAATLLMLHTDVHAADEIHWTLTSPTAVTVDWRGTTGTLRYGLTSSYGITVTAVTPAPLPYSSSGPFWEARLSGLKPDTPYHYSIAGGPDRTLRTMPAAGTSYDVYVEGDIGDSGTYPRVAAVQSLIAQGSPRFVLVVGDLTYGNDDGQAVVDQHFNDVMVWSEKAAYLPAWGNHEWSKTTDDFRNYKGRFDFPNPQTSPGAPSAGCCGEDWYWFDCGKVRFIAYPEPYSGAWSDWNTRAKALMDAAQASSAIRFIVTFGHRPAYSSGYHAGDATLKGYLDALGASHGKYLLNLNGHSHNYERSTPQSGVTHVTVGTGGSTLEEASGSCLYTGGCPPPSWSAFRAFHHGTLRLHITDTAIRGDMLCGPAGDSGSNRNDITCAVGDIFDSFTIGGGDQPPVVVAPALKTGTPGTALSEAVTASDPDGNAISSLTADLSKLPAGNTATFTTGSGNLSGTLKWTPAAKDTGTFMVTFRAANAMTGSATTQLGIHAGPVDVPPGLGALGLAIERVTPNPAVSELRVAYALASADGARIELVDGAGRIVRQQDLGQPGPGHHEVRLKGGAELRSGIYWLRLTQGGRFSSTPVVFVH